MRPSCGMGLLAVLCVLLVGCARRETADLAGPGGEAAGEAPAEASFPQLALTNGQVRLKLYLPDAEKGYYRGSRFEWSGVVARAEYKGHTFFGPWRPYDAKGHDNIMGTAEEFSMARPLGFEEVDAGGVFFKIGVGALAKKEKPKKNEQTGQMDPAVYGFWLGHRIVEAGPWEVTHGPDWVKFVQDFKPQRGWGWRYVKRLELAKDAPRFAIRRRLTNTGKKAIDTTHYCHNFTIIDGEPIGPAYRVRLPYEAHAAELKGTLAAVKGREIVFLGELTEGKSVWMSLGGLTGTAKDNDVVVENVRTGAGLHITGDRPLAEMRFWAAPRAACPEPFVAIKLAPGESMAWQNTYTFQVRPAKASP